MGLYVAIIALRLPSHVETQNNAFLSQMVEVSVNRTETDMGQTAADNIAQFVRCRMAG